MSGLDKNRISIYNFQPTDRMQKHNNSIRHITKKGFHPSKKDGISCRTKKYDS